MNELSIRVRGAVASDAPRLAELRFALRSSVKDVHESREVFVARCTAWMAERLGERSAWQCWVACDGSDDILGCVWVQRIEKLPNPNGLAGDNAYVSNFFVADEYRSRGIGSALLDAATAWCDSSGIDITFLWPTERSRPIYARYGFSVEGRLMERQSR